MWSACSRRWLLVALALVAPLAAQEVERPPNIVLLYADDAGYADFGFQKDAAADMKDMTPHIDSIAKAGVTLTNAYMSGCVCSPSRAGMLTGRYQTRFGHEFNIPPGYMKQGLPLSETFVTKRLKPLGYKTALVGKWHLGYPEDYHPNKRGFDWFYGCLQGSRPYFPMKKPTKHRVLQENGKPTEEGGYTTDRLGDAAVRFIEENKAKPFFLFVSFTAPHGPLQAKQSDLEKLEHISKLRRRKYAGLVKALDDNVGKVLGAIREHGLGENTLVVFTNDNGGATHTGANNGKLRGKKGTLFEGGIRVPMCMRWPGKFEAGSTIDDPVISLDFVPTFVAAAGGEVESEWKLDGVNLLPLLKGQVTEHIERPLYWRKGTQAALRLGRYKLHIPDVGKEGANVFDLVKDIGESQPLDAGRIHTRLLEAWKKLDSEMVEPKWKQRNRQGRQRRKRKRKR